MNFKKLLAIPALILGLLAIVHLSRSIVDIYGRRGRVSGLQEEIAGLEREKAELEEERAFRQTEEFVEREARDKLRMVREGEYILVLPDAQNKKISNLKSQISDDEGTKANWEKWMEYWFK
jgi:cell division protein FtsB